MKEISTFKCIPLIPQRFSVVKYLCWILSKYFSNSFLFRYRSVYILNQYWIFFMFMIKLKQTNKAVAGEKIILLSIPGATSILSFEHFGWNVHFVKKNKKKRGTFHFRRSFPNSCDTSASWKKAETEAIFWRPGV